MIANFGGKVVLVTGGTMGIGLATGLAFGRRGAECWLTYRWGSADEDEVRRAFAEAGAPPPRIFQADVASDEDTDALLATMRAHHQQVEVFVSNVAAAPVVQDLADYSARGLFKAIEYSAWPFVEYTRRIRQAFGRYPRYIVGMSSTGPDSFAFGYDLAAAAKAVLETLCRYLSYRLADADVRINVIRSRAVRTETARAHFGADAEPFGQRFLRPDHWIEPEKVAEAAVALCSGLMDGVSGQVIMVDRGTSFSDNLMGLYTERNRLGL